jgi:hypothetical protein
VLWAVIDDEGLENETIVLADQEYNEEEMRMGDKYRFMRCPVSSSRLESSENLFSRYSYYSHSLRWRFSDPLLT